MIKVLGQCRRGNEQLGVRSGHDGCEDSRQEDACDKEREELGDHGDVDDLLLAVAVEQAVAENHAAGNTDHDRGGQRDNDPYRRDAAGFFDCRRRGNAHKAHEDVRLTEVAEAPCNERDDA